MKMRSDSICSIPAGRLSARPLAACSSFTASLTAICLSALTTVPPAKAEQARSSNGAALYEEKCAVCHGADGSGAMSGIPDLTGPEGPLSKPDQELLKSIILGIERPGAPVAMPASDLGPEEARRVLAYVRSAFRSK